MYRGVHALLALLLLACAGASQSGQELTPGSHEIALSHDGAQRFYLVRVPPGASGGRPLPVVVSFHGGGGHPEEQRDKTRLDEWADREGFLAVHPAGNPGRLLSRRLLTWNAGDCCGRAARGDADDVGFVLALLRDLARRTPVDATRVYAMGHSNGAMMAMRLAHDAGSHLAGIAAIGGVADLPPPPVAVPLLQIHSVDDPRALYAGGLGPPFPITGTRVEHAPVDAVLAAWAGAAGCSGEPVEEAVRRAEGAGQGEANTATLRVWQGCAAPLRQWRLTGVGHGWPGAEPARGRVGKRLGPPTLVIDATGEAWRFFQELRRPQAPPLS